MTSYHRTWNYREIGKEEWLKINDGWKDKLRLFLAVTAIYPQDINPEFQPMSLGEISFDKLYKTLNKYKNVKKYEIGIFNKRTIFGGLSRKNQLGWITCKINKLNKKYNEHDYPTISIFIHGFDTLNAYQLSKSLALAIEELLKLTPTIGQVRHELSEIMRVSVRNFELLQSIEPIFSKGEYDNSLTLGSSLVEKKLKEKILMVGGVVLPSHTGFDLCKVAYHDSTGCLLPPYPVSSQACHGAFLLFQGFFIYIRNAFMHSNVLGNDGDAALSFIKQCDILLNLIENSKKR